jgi:hypothetical protein
MASTGPTALQETALSDGRRFAGVYGDFVDGATDWIAGTAI